MKKGWKPSSCCLCSAKNATSKISKEISRKTRVVFFLQGWVLVKFDTVSVVQKSGKILFCVLSFHFYFSGCQPVSSKLRFPKPNSIESKKTLQRNLTGYLIRAVHVTKFAQQQKDRPLTGRVDFARKVVVGRQRSIPRSAAEKKRSANRAAEGWMNGKVPNVVNQVVKLQTFIFSPRTLGR